MTEILLRTDLSHDTDLTKIGASIYFDQKTCTFYRLSFLPHCVIFLKEEVSQPRIASLTKYDPYFLLINLLSKSKIKHEEVPEYLKHLDFSKISEKDETHSHPCYSLNKGKVFDFLETKVRKLQKCIRDHNLQKSFFKTELADERYISNEIITVLKSEIVDHHLIDTFARQRYAYTPLKKVMPEEVEEKQPFKYRSKPKIQTKKEEPKLQHNQKTLNSFFTGKPKPNK